MIKPRRSPPPIDTRRRLRPRRQVTDRSEPSLEQGTARRNQAQRHYVATITPRPPKREERKRGREPHLAVVRLERGVDCAMGGVSSGSRHQGSERGRTAKVTGNVIALHAFDLAILPLPSDQHHASDDQTRATHLPLASKGEVAGRLPADVCVAEVNVQDLRGLRSSVVSTDLVRFPPLLLRRHAPLGP